MSAIAETCVACPILRQQLEIAQAQNKQLLEHIVNLADPLALARLAPRPAAAPTESRKPPVTSPAMLRLHRPDRATDEQLREYEAGKAEARPDGLTDNHAAIEASFAKQSG